MLEILEFIFSSWQSYFGTLLLVLIIAEGFGSGITGIIKRIKKI